MKTESVGIVGAGAMGREIALVFALSGRDVILIDVSETQLAEANNSLRSIVERGIAKGFYQDDARLALDRISTDVDLSACRSADVVVEAIIEDESIKRELFSRLDIICQPQAMLASNTSTIPISTLASAVPADRRGKFIGLHFFSPATRMALVEIIPGFSTNANTVELAQKIILECGKVPVLVKDVAGFAVNRMFNALLIEAIRLVDEGVISLNDADQLCQLGLGHPVGPFKLMDIIGLDLTLRAQEVLYESYGERFRPPALLKQKVAAGHVGKRCPGWLVE